MNAGPARQGPPRWGPPTVRGVAAAVLVPLASTGLALAIPHGTAAGAASLYLLGVVVVAASGGLWAGLAASVLSFLGLNFYFTEPRHTFAVHRAGDVVALAVFFAVAAIVGALVARALESRDRARRRALESERLQRATSLLASERPFQTQIADVAESICEVFGLVRCRIEVVSPDQPVEAEAVNGGPAGPSTRVPIGPRDRPLGEIEVVTRAGAPALFPEDLRLLEAFSGQVALAAHRVRTEAEARSARLDAETSSLRAALFSSVTHDLRTPLASIMASVTGLIDSGDAMEAEQRRELLRTILEEADRLNRLVGNLLDLARLRAGALTPSLTTMGVEEVVEAVLARLRTVLAPFRVQTVIRPNLPEARLDPVQMDQALTNVLENAARFSPPGSEIRVTVTSFRGAVEVRVADQGPGIPEDERQTAFEPFHSKDAGRGRGGAGLGLAIARAVVEAHGGRIAIEGSPGGGTAIVMRLPAAPSPESVPPAAATNRASAGR